MIHETKLTPCGHCHKFYDPEKHRHTPEAQYQCHVERVIARRSFLMGLAAAFIAPKIPDLGPPRIAYAGNLSTSSPGFNGRIAIGVGDGGIIFDKKISLSDLIATTIEARSKEIVDNVTRNNELLAMMDGEINGKRRRKW